MRLICHHDRLPWKPLTQSLPLDPNSSIDQVVLGYLSPPIKDNGIIFKKGNKLIKNLSLQSTQAHLAHLAITSIKFCPIKD